MKLAVHWAPAVNSCTPGWMAALEEGAHVGAALAAVPITSGARHPMAIRAAEAAAHLRGPFSHETRTHFLPGRGGRVLPGGAVRPNLPFGTGPGLRSRRGVPRR